MDLAFTTKIHPRTVRVFGQCPNPLWPNSLLAPFKGPNGNESSTKPKKTPTFTKGLPTFWKHTAPGYN